MKNLPVISIVTVSYNALATIEKTILSVINQTYPNIEYIIIDGRSTDGTVDIIKKYANKIAYWISEPDKGIYDAMNKGGLKATGEWLQFLNCGDKLHDNNVLSNIFLSSDNDNVGIIYGDMVKITRVGAFWGKPYPLDRFKSSFPVFHPSSYIRRNVFITFMFDTSYRIAADYALYRQLYLRGVIFKYISVKMVVFDGINGVSSTNPLACYKEEGRILGKEKTWSWMCKYVLLCTKLFVNKITKKVILKIVPSYYSRIALYKMKKNPRYTELEEMNF